MAVGGLVRLIPQPGAEDELLERALDVAADVRGEPGNVAAFVLRDPENPRDVLMFELFEDAAAIDAHHAARHSVEKGPQVFALLATPMQVLRLETPGG